MTKSCLAKVLSIMCLGYYSGYGNAAFEKTLRRFTTDICLSNRKFERLDLVGPLDEIVTVSVHKYNVIMSRPNMTSFHSRDGLPRRWLLHFTVFLFKTDLNAGKCSEEAKCFDYANIKSFNIFYSKFLALQK